MQRASLSHKQINLKAEKQSKATYRTLVRHVQGNSEYSTH